MTKPPTYLVAPTVSWAGLPQVSVSRTGNLAMAEHISPAARENAQD